MEITPEDLLPFYVAIVAQTSGNPMSIYGMPLDCIKSHPLRADLERLVWEKPRAHAEQYADFHIGKAWSAPSLVRRLGTLNENLRNEHAGKDADKLFLCVRPRRRTARLPSWATFHLLLDPFIEKHRLPHFDFRDLRRSTARSFHIKEESQEAARRRLHHRRVQSSATYSPLSDRAREHELVIHRFQGEIVSASQLLSANGEGANRNGSENKGCKASTVFGFDCADPLAGFGGHSPVGQTCLHFQQCATCPGALVTLDDVLIVARLLAALEGLEAAAERAKVEGWWARYALLYEPTRIVLTTELLPSVSESVKTKAMAAMPQHLIPWLE